MITFVTRAQVRKTDLGTFKHYRAADRTLPYKVVLTPTKAWLAIQVLANGSELILDRRKSRKAAERVCSKHGLIA